MTQDSQREHISKRAVVYRIPGMEAVEVRRDVPYRTDEAGTLTMDIYYPPELPKGAAAPAVVFALGYSDRGAERLLGCKLKEMASYVSWARLAAASGLVAITYTNREPAEDLRALIRHARLDGAGLGVDSGRVGLWACSGNVPLALAALMDEGRASVKCAALCYGHMLDAEGPGVVAEAAATFGFVNPCAGKSFDDLPRDVPLFIARAGRDQFPRLNETIDRFLAEALSRNLPVTLVNHAEAPHAFDLFDEGPTTREVIRRILAFLRFHLLTSPGGVAARR